MGDRVSGQLKKTYEYFGKNEIWYFFAPVKNSKDFRTCKNIR
jgi:hypothetical protein